MKINPKYLYIVVPVVFVMILLAAKWVWGITVNTSWNVTVGINACYKASGGQYPTCSGSYYPAAAYNASNQIINPSSASVTQVICCKTAE